MDALEALLTRRCIRKFQDKPVEIEIIKKAIDAGRLAPSGNNVQPVKFVVILDKENLKKLAQITTPNGDHLLRAAGGIVILAEPVKYYLEDGAAATENVMLALWAQGVGSVWIAGDKKDYASEVVKFVGGKDEKLISIIAFGYPAETPAPPKKKLEDVLFFEKLK